MSQETHSPETQQQKMIESERDAEPDSLESLLPANAWSRYDETPDEAFYHQPRLVTHIDEAAITYVTNLYREMIPAGAQVLDLMSSWVSHLPPDVSYKKVSGVGMNRAELVANRRLSERIVQNLNREQALPFAGDEFDAAVICVSIQYLTKPVEVIKEVGRVLRTDAPLVVTFSNRCFPTKAVMAWQALNDEGHIALVKSYLHHAAAFDRIEHRVKPFTAAGDDPLYAVIGRKKLMN